MNLTWQACSIPIACTSASRLPAKCLQTVLLVLTVWIWTTGAMTKSQLAELKQETLDMFYHGFDNYMDIAFPEDELRPITCQALTRDRDDPGNLGLNDVLGNYSLTLVDSLSTLAIFASSSAHDSLDGPPALQRFQDGVRLVVEYYGDGSSGPRSRGKRATGFDLDSKVQVFETVIRGVGGLLSAHLFAIGELPVWGYKPDLSSSEANPDILWPNGFVYDGQLLRLAYDLATRILPAFNTLTGLPYPRVNLRHGIPFYPNSPLFFNSQEGHCPADGYTESDITETCSAGAGTLVLEFSALSRLTGDDRFEIVAKRAFWEVWGRRSQIGLIGSGIDSENGQWTSAITGIGAGVDSFFEYALKSYILLSGHPFQGTTSSGNEPRSLLEPEHHSSQSFLSAWQEAHFAVKRHLYRDFHHPHYINAHLNTGSPQALWVDSLGAYYPGLLVLAGELDEAMETHLLYSALWSRYSALPERWSTKDGGIEGGLGWWPGRPEFIESTYHLYRATKDPWYLHVGEMVLRDIKRRCWTRCGWAGLQDVRTGEQSDRMESFFLGETAKYLFLLFDEAHPFNKLDASFVFTTEGHPLIIPSETKNFASSKSEIDEDDNLLRSLTCPRPKSHIPLSVSVIAARSDYFHAASFTKLHLMPDKRSIESPLVEFNVDHPSITVSDLLSPTNYTFYPWTLPTELIPERGTCSKIEAKPTFEIQFPINHPNLLLGQQLLARMPEGVMINSLEGLRLGMVREIIRTYGDGEPWEQEVHRIQSIGLLALGRDERVFIKRNLVRRMLDWTFSRVKDTLIIDVCIEHSTNQEMGNDKKGTSRSSEDLGQLYSHAAEQARNSAADVRHFLNSFLWDPEKTWETRSLATSASETIDRIPASLSTGPGAAALSDVSEFPAAEDSEGLAAFEGWTRIYLADEACNGPLERSIPREHQVIVLKRGGCSFSSKLRNIPSFVPSPYSLRLVLVVSYSEDDEDYDGLVKPFLDSTQYTPSGLTRHHQIPLALVAGGKKTYDSLAEAKRVGLRRRYHMNSQGLPINNLFVI